MIKWKGFEWEFEVAYFVSRAVAWR